MPRSQLLRAAICTISTVILWFGPASAADALAVVDGEVISYEEYEQFAYAEARQTYYHGKPPEGQAMIEFRQQMADELIDRKLMVGEARRRGLEADNDKVSAQLAGYEQQYGGTDRWKTEGAAMLAKLRAHFEAESLLEQVDAVLRAVPDPAEGEVEAYYSNNLDKFTEPEKVRVSVILLSVPAWSDQEGWDAAREEATDIAARIREGESFAEAARQYSADPTASNGGDMGYLHAGALNYAVQEVVSDLQPGEMAAEPVTVLEGVVVVRLEDRKEAQVHAFPQVEERATGLWQRETAEQAYAAALEGLRAGADIQIDETYLKSLPE